MACAFNHITLQGWATKTPILLWTNKKQPFIKCGINSPVYWWTEPRLRDQSDDGRPRRNDCVIDFVVFGKRALAIHNLVRKGDVVMVEGNLKLDVWKNKNTGMYNRIHCVMVKRFNYIMSAETWERQYEENQEKYRAAETQDLDEVDEVESKKPRHRRKKADG